MKAEELNKWLLRWALKPADGAKILGIDVETFTKYLDGDTLIPEYIRAHVETFDSLDEKAATKIIRHRISLLHATNGASERVSTLEPPDLNTISPDAVITNLCDEICNGKNVIVAGQDLVFINDLAKAILSGIRLKNPSVADHVQHYLGEIFDNQSTLIFNRRRQYKFGVLKTMSAKSCAEVFSKITELLPSISQHSLDNPVHLVVIVKRTDDGGPKITECFIKAV